MAQSDTARKKRAERAAARRAQREARRSGDAGDGTGKPPKSKTREWLDALLFAVIVMLIVRTLLFDLFRIPTPSMEENLLVGDYLFVSKLHYGTRLPMGVCVPFTALCVPGIDFPYTRVPGFSEIERSDAIVFNYPPEEQRVDRKTHYIKRVIGMPGDTLSVQNKVVHIDGTPMPLAEGMQQLWNVFKTHEGVRLSSARLREIGIDEVLPTANPLVVRIQATQAEADALAQWSYVDRVDPFVVREAPAYSALMYPPGRAYTPDMYGPVVIPQAGMTVELTPETWPVYGPVITRYEGHTAQQRADGSYAIDGTPATSYTFGQDYFFVMGDNRDNSEDSRFWGFVPEDHIVGKAILTYFSWNAEGNLLQKIRFDRLFRLIH